MISLSQNVIDSLTEGHLDEDLLETTELASLDEGIDEEIEAGQTLREDGASGLAVDHMMNFDEDSVVE